MMYDRSFSPSKQSRRRCEGSGFTLLELLISVTVIVLLASLLIPVLGRARDRGNLALCQAHLHTIGVGTLLYAGANGGALPVSQQLDNPQRELIDTLYQGKYVTDPPVYFCPSEVKPELCFSAGNFAAGNVGYFYFSCLQATRNGAVSQFLRWNVAWPRLLRDHLDGDTWVTSDIWFSAVPTAHRYYAKGINYFTLDGSVRMVYDSPRQHFK
jgi:prepilin-type N-terminal cleavage/methylation domain-containing protein